MNEIRFTDNIKLSDLINSKSYLILMLPRFGIHLGFGDKTVAEVCHEYGIDPCFFLLICNVYSFDDYIPSTETLKSVDMSPLIHYLHQSHVYYIDKRLPHISSHIDNIAKKLPPKVAAVLKHFFGEYRKEVDAHFQYEETNVFPHIEKLLEGIHDDTYRIKTFLSSHSNIDDKLDDLTQIIFKYLPDSESVDEEISVVLDILRLSHDLKKHTLIEEKILVPYVQALERQIK